MTDNTTVATPGNIIEVLKRTRLELSLTAERLWAEADAAAKRFWTIRAEWIAADAAMNAKADRTYVATSTRVRPLRMLRVEAEWIALHAKGGAERIKPDKGRWSYTDGLLAKKLPAELHEAARETERVFESVRRRSHALVGVGAEIDRAIAALATKGGMEVPSDGTKAAGRRR